MTIKSKSLEETEEIAKKFVEELAPNKNFAVIVALYGDLGSGKTTFVKAVAKTFGLEKTVTSPTFVIEKIYPIRTDGRSKRPTSNGTSKIEDPPARLRRQAQAGKNFDHLIHIDAYRLKSADELKSLGWEEILKNPRNIIFIEWPENVKDILPENKQEIHFKFIDENTREIVIN